LLWLILVSKILQYYISLLPEYRGSHLFIWFPLLNLDLVRGILDIFLLDLVKIISDLRSFSTVWITKNRFSKGDLWLIVYFWFSRWLNAQIIAHTLHILIVWIVEMLNTLNLGNLILRLQYAWMFSWIRVSEFLCQAKRLSTLIIYRILFGRISIDRGGAQNRFSLWVIWLRTFFIGLSECELNKSYFGLSECTLTIMVILWNFKLFWVKELNFVMHHFIFLLFWNCCDVSFLIIFPLIFVKADLYFNFLRSLLGVEIHPSFLKLYHFCLFT
jgi:hypothetical protein